MLLSCPVCLHSSFPDMDSLRSSLVKAANGILSCPICCDQLLGLDKLIIHLFSHSSSPIKESDYCDPVIKCAQHHTHHHHHHNRTVADAFEDESISSLQQKQQEKIKCQSNESNVVQKDSLQSCEKIHQSETTATTAAAAATSMISNVKPFKCHICSKTFKMNGLLRLHLKVVHWSMENVDASVEASKAIEKDTTEIPITLEDSQTNQGININNFKVNKCIKTANNAINQNELLHEIYSQNNELPAATSESRFPTSELDSSKIWKCDVCMKAFTTKYFLKKHKRLHTGEMPYTCGICSRTFTFQQSYHKHLLYHSDQKPHICSTCGRAFKELSTLHNHQRIHSGEKPFKCEICDKSFRQRVSFLVHTRIHTGVMPYKCDTCQKSFRYKVSQRTHKCSPPINSGSDVDQTTTPQNLLALLDNTPLLEKLPTSSPTPDGENNSNNISVEKGFDATQEILSKAIDAFVVESCQKLGIKKSEHQSPTTNNDQNKSTLQLQMPVNSKLQDMCIYTSLTDQFAELNSSSFLEFLYN